MAGRGVSFVVGAVLGGVVVWVAGVDSNREVTPEPRGEAASREITPHAPEPAAIPPRAAADERADEPSLVAGELDSVQQVLALAEEELQRESQKRIALEMAVLDFLRRPDESVAAAMTRVTNSPNLSHGTLAHTMVILGARDEDPSEAALRLLGGFTLAGEAIAASRYLGRFGDASDIVRLEQMFDEANFRTRFPVAMALHEAGEETYLESWIDEASTRLRRGEPVVRSILQGARMFPRIELEDLLEEIVRTVPVKSDEASRILKRLGSSG